MAKYDVTYSCGHTGTVNLIGKHKDREWKLSREETKLCPECWKNHQEEERRKENADAIAENQAAGLPPLEGSEKQVPWAETIRKEVLKKLEQHARRLFENSERAARLNDFDSGIIELALQAIRNRSSAHWWIDNRGEADNIMAAMAFLKKEYELAKKEQDAPPAAVVEAAHAEATVRPEKPKTETVAEIKIVGNNAVKIAFPEKREDFWGIVKKQLGYKWTGAWERELTPQNGTLTDRAAEAGHVLLGAGFIIRIFDPVIRDMAITGNYEPEQTRWIYRRKKGAKYEGWFAITWQRSDDFYSAARKLPGSRWDSPSVVVPSEQFEEVLDFAEKYGFSLTEKAQTVANTARAAKESALVAHVEPVKREAVKADIKPPTLDVPEGVEMDESLRDDN